MPTSLDLPNIETVIVEVPNPVHPYGVRGVGEVPIVPPVPAVGNAIKDAIGIRLRETPMNAGRIVKGDRGESLVVSNFGHRLQERNYSWGGEIAVPASAANIIGCLGHFSSGLPLMTLERQSQSPNAVANEDLMYRPPERDDDGEVTLDDIMDRIKEMFAGIPGFGGGDGNRSQSSNGQESRGSGRAGAFVLLIIPLAAVVWLATGVYTVSPEEQAALRTFGRFRRHCRPRSSLALAEPYRHAETSSQSRPPGVWNSVSEAHPTAPAPLRFRLNRR